MSKGFPHVPESIMLEPDTDIIYTEQETYNYEQEKIQNNGNKDDNEDDQDNKMSVDPSVRGVLTKRLWNFILARSAIPADTKYVMIYMNINMNFNITMKVILNGHLSGCKIISIKITYIQRDSFF